MTKRDKLDSGVAPTSVENYLLEVDNPLVVPVGTKVRVLVTAADVIHAWWVPDFGMKKDAIPGYINELWFKADEVGTYRGQCTELCGRDHGVHADRRRGQGGSRVRRLARRPEGGAPGGRPTSRRAVAGCRDDRAHPGHRTIPPRPCWSRTRSNRT